MKTSTIIWIIVLLIIVVGGVWWYMSAQSSIVQPVMTTTTTPTSTDDTMQVMASSTLSVANDPVLGNYLAAANGMTLYTYSKDTAGTSNCTGTCATNWPPYTVASADAIVAANNPAMGSSIGTFTRADGTIQVTYNNMPLYFWNQDVKVGDVTGDGVGGFAVAKP